MKKNHLCILICFGLVGCMATPHVRTERSANFQTDTHKKIAMFLHNDMTGAVSEALTTEFMGMGYEVVERSNMSAVLKEMKLDYSGFIDRAQQKEVARVTGAEAIMFGSVLTTLGGRIYCLDLRLTDIATGEILWSSNYVNRDFDNPRISIKEISKSIQTKIQAPIKADNLAYVNQQTKITALNEQVKTDPLNREAKELLSNAKSKMDLMSKDAANSRISIARNVSSLGKKYKKIALLPLTGMQNYGEGEAIYGALVTDFIGNGVGMVERKELDSILEEQGKGAAGVYNQIKDSKSQNENQFNAVQVVSTSAFTRELYLSKKELSEMGRITGADALLMGSFQAQVYSPFTFSIANLRLLDLETGKIVWSASYYNDSNMGEDYILTADWLSLALAPIISAESMDDYIKKYDLAMENAKSGASYMIEKLTPAK